MDQLGQRVDVPRGPAPFGGVDRNRQLEEEVNTLREELERVRVTADVERREHQTRLSALERHAALPHFPQGPPLASFPQHVSPLNLARGVPLAVNGGATRWTSMQQLGGQPGAQQLTPPIIRSASRAAPIATPLAPLPPVQSGLVVSRNYNQVSKQYGARQARFQASTQEFQPAFAAVCQSTDIFHQQIQEAIRRSMA